MRRNIGFYIPIINDEEINIRIYNSLNKAIGNHQIRDGTIFFNDISFNPVVPKFSIMNATDIWSFTGDLFSLSLDNSLQAINIVNKFNLFHLYNKERDDNFFKLLKVANNAKVITSNNSDAKEFKRVTGKDCIKVEDFTVQNLLEVIQ